MMKGSQAAMTNAQQTDTSPKSSADKVEDLGVITDRYDVTTLRELSGWDAALALLSEEYGTLENAEEVIGTGFALMRANGKGSLVDEPFVVMHCMFPESNDHKDPETGEWLHYAVAHIITKDGRKLVMTDGGAGIYRQLEEWALRSGRRGGLIVNGGLRESTYELPDGSGTGTTYYLAV
jgi:hypothetical protein